MPKLWILSDLHMELSRWILPGDMLGQADVAVLAGDVHRPLTRSLRWLDEQRQSGPLAGCEIVMVAGNHEFYQVDLDDERKLAAPLARELGIHLLDRSHVVLGDVRFVGCVQWTDYGLLGDPTSAMEVAEQSINDHRVISLRGQSFTPQDALAEHQADLAWLKGVLAAPHTGPTVVVTHHCVSKRSVHARWITDPASPAFSSNLDDTVEASGREMCRGCHTIQIVMTSIEASAELGTSECSVSAPISITSAVGLSIVRTFSHSQLVMT